MLINVTEFVIGVIFWRKSEVIPMQRIKKLTAIILSILTLSSVCVFGTATSASAKGTGIGLAEWSLNAYYEGWEYVYGGCTPGTVDCSGLIYSYCGGERCGNPQLNTATARGNVSDGIPNIHGLGLWRPGHVGVYVGDNMEVDARGDAYNMCYESIGGYNNWTYWFKLAACSYPSTGWEKFNGSYYYYENGEYITSTSRTIGGVTYNFDSKGRSDQTPADMSATSSSGSSNSSTTATKPSKPTSWRNGSTGEEVEKIQTRLKELGYYTGAVDGHFGDATEKAYRAFQKAAGLLVDGIAGSDREVLYSDDAPYAPKEEEPTTAPVEEETTEETTPEEDASEEDASEEYKSGDENETVMEIQTKLAELLYLDVEPTGYYGDFTVQSVMNFQLANGLEATGIVDKATYDVLFGENAVTNPNPTVAEETTQPTTDFASGPVQMPITTNPSELIIVNEQNQTYTDTASEVVKKTNSVTKKALLKSSSVIPAARTAEVKRTANVWLWFVLVAVILGALATVVLVRDRKATRYARYNSRKSKNTFKAEVNTRW